MIQFDRAGLLAQHLDGAQADAHFWRDSHCLLFLAKWVALARPGFDLAPYLDRCVGPVSAMKALKAEGGIDAYMTREAAKHGLPLVDAAASELGDVALVRAPRASRPGFLTFGCIRTAERWAIRAVDGVVSIHVETIRVQPHLVWRV